MSTSTHVVGVRPPDRRWHQMKAVWDACQAADIPAPEAVQEFFDWQDPNPDGVVVALSSDHYREWSDATGSGHDVTITGLPPDVTVVRVYTTAI